MVKKTDAKSDCIHLDARANGWTRCSMTKDSSEQSQNGDESSNVGIQQSALSDVGLKKTISLVERVQHETPADMLRRCLIDEMVDRLCGLFGGVGDGGEEVEVDVEEVRFYSQSIGNHRAEVGEWTETDRASGKRNNDFGQTLKDLLEKIYECFQTVFLCRVFLRGGIGHMGVGVVVVLKLFGGEGMPLGRLVNEVFLECMKKEKEENAVVSSVFEMTLKNGEIGGERREYAFL